MPASRLNVSPSYIVCAPAATAVNDKSAVNIAFLIISIVINGYLLPPPLLEPPPPPYEPPELLDDPPPENPPPE